MELDELQKDWFLYQGLRYVIGLTHDEAIESMNHAKTHTIRENAKE